MSAVMKIHDSEYTIDKVFSDNFTFEIPHHLALHRWTTEQVGGLLEHILSGQRGFCDDESPIADPTAVRIEVVPEK